jgi:hypothetical protein
VIVGGDVFSGAIAVIVALGELDAESVPAAFEAVTSEESV